ncbi:unnamed protein product, partial [Coregonus sp. 'balchen']
MSPTFKLDYSGDTIKVSCDNSTGTIKWFFSNNGVQEKDSQTWSIAAVSATNSGSYQCESNGQKNQIELSLRCVVKGIDQISRTIFYKDGKKIEDSGS